MNNVVLKGKLGVGFNDDRYTLPKDGNPGDILVKTETGSAWEKQEPATSTPDWNQNDQTASDYIKNRPGGYTVNHPALNIEWDGVIGDRVSVDVNGAKFVKVSDEIPKVEQLVGGAFIFKNGDASHTVNINGSVNDDGNGIYGVEGLLIVYKAPENLVIPGMGSLMVFFPETGVYFLYRQQGEMTAYVSSLSLSAKSEIVPIPQEYVEGVKETAIAASKALNAVESFSHTTNGRYHGSYDKKTEGRDTFIFNAFDYYKISDFVIAYEEILDFAGTNVNNVDISTVSNGENCVACGLFIVVNRAGQCSLTVETNKMYFTAPSTGLYACYNGATNGSTAGTYDFRFNVVEPIVTNHSTRKKYYITVDDTGTLKATEVT